MSVRAIETIDTLQFGLPQSGAVYVLGESTPVLIESGTASSVSRTLDALRARKQNGMISPKYIFLTHIHLDHAGGAGHLARTFPDTKIVVHERGAKHLADPRQLLEGVRMAAPDTFQLYGTPLPIPDHQIISVAGGEIFELGNDLRVEVIASPGHAPHHVCYYEQTTGTLFTGDAVGNYGTPVDVPLTVPPRFHLLDARTTLQALKKLNPERLAFTHFGITDAAIRQIQRYEQQIESWFDDIRNLTRSLESEEVVRRILSRPTIAKVSETQQHLIAMCVRGAILSLQAGTA